MSKIRKLILIFISISVFWGLNFNYNLVNASSSSDLFLNKLDFNAVINSDGSMDVTETWNISIADTNTLFKTFETDKSRYSEINNVKVVQVTSNGNEKELTEINKLMYHVTKDCYYGMINDDGDFEIAWGVGLDSSRDTRTYKISYTVEDAIKNCKDCSELYWQFVGEDFEINANKITGKITLPDKCENKSDIKVWGHTEGLNGEIYATSNDTVEFEVNQFKNGNFVEVRVAIPEEINIDSGRKDTISLQNIINEETVLANKANQRRFMKKATFFLLQVFIILIEIGLIILFIYRIIKNNKIYKDLPKKFKPSQDFKYFRDLPEGNDTPAEAYRILKQKLGEFYSTEVGNIFSATLLDLGLKGYLSFETIEGKFGKNNIRIILNDKNTSGIANEKDELEIYLFIKSAAKSKGGSITNKELEKYIKNNETKVLSLKKQLDKKSRNGIFQKNYASQKAEELKDNHSSSVIWYILLIFFGYPVSITCFFKASVMTNNLNLMNIINNMLLITIFILCIINIVIKIKTANKINVFTQLGVDRSNEWKGLKKFMEEFSMLDKREVPEIVIWEKYLVYATAFGIADKVIKQLKIVYPNIEQIDNLNTGIYMGLMMNTDFSSSFSHSISSAMSSTYSSGSGGGGGFSGGGGRWPEAVGGGGGR